MTISPQTKYPVFSSINRLARLLSRNKYLFTVKQTGITGVVGLKWFAGVSNLKLQRCCSTNRIDDEQKVCVKSCGLVEGDVILETVAFEIRIR